ncbi:lysozyme family protein [Radiobacillus kanasensis]|uniref:lysozyme family protein n=1 Tax=Radiobacillus kanasensis TaxID=2844358 RepID=UPI001E378299|nr:lysozyme family protein [Radiobacillus kanasensis]UFT99695.1 lysozyme family protein [Radiobacillus kanasensis]
MKKRRGTRITRRKLLIGFIGMLFGLYAVAYLAANYEGSPPESPYSLSAQVLEYESEVEAELKKAGLENYTAVVLALMMQESGGRGTDPMQASESYCGEVGCIKDPNISIEKGVEYFGRVLTAADYDVKLALQSYNFGRGFIDFVQQNGDGYTQDLAIQFSQQKYKELSHTGKYSCIREEAEKYEACYGDILYVDAVLNYYEEALKHTKDTKVVAFQSS